MLMSLQTESSLKTSEKIDYKTKNIDNNYIIKSKITDKSTKSVCVKPEISINIIIINYYHTSQDLRRSQFL